MTNMGAVPALGFVAPLFLFRLHHSLDPCASTSGFRRSTGFRGGHRAARTRAVSSPPRGQPRGDTMLAAAFLISRSAVIFACGVLAGAGRRATAATIRSKYRGGNRPRLRHQLVRPARFRPRWWTACSPPARQPAAMRGRSPSCSSTIRGFYGRSTRPHGRRRLSTDWTRRLRYWVEIVDRNGRHREQVFSETVFLALFWCAARRSRRAAARRHVRARNACRDRAGQCPQ